MFRKIVSNLNFSPALVGQLGFYAKRLRKEEMTRRLGLIFTALALIVQSLAVFSPPEAANARSGADFIPGGVSSTADFLRYYDRNSNNIKDVFKSLGITRSEIQNTKRTVIGEASRYNWSMTSLYSYSQGQRSWHYQKSSGKTGTVFYRPMRLTQEGGDRHVVFAGHSSAIGWFAIKKDCGNLITSHPPTVKNPEAFCRSLTVAPINASTTQFRMTTQARTRDGAKIKGYTYVIRDAKGNLVDTKPFASTEESHSFTYDQVKLGIYKVRVTVNTTEGNKSGPNCDDSFTVAEKPAAFCKNVSADVADRTIVTVGGSAGVANGATIKKYTFVITNKKTGEVVKRIPMDSSKLSVVADSFNLATDGTYKVVLTVETSLGTSTNADCETMFTIQPPKSCAYNPSLPSGDPRCQPCPDNPDIWIGDSKCTNIVNAKTAVNMSQGSVAASTVAAKANDKITYTISVENRGSTTTTTSLKESLKDVLEYAKLIDLGSGTFDKASNTLSWSNVTLAAHQKQSRTFAVQMYSDIPATNTGKSDAASYDCTMVNTFGNSVSIKVACPAQKVVVEQVTKELPHTGPRENMMFAAGLLAVVVYFYARSRQLGKEVRLIRHNTNIGTI